MQCLIGLSHRQSWQLLAWCFTWAITSMPLVIAFMPLNCSTLQLPHRSALYQRVDAMVPLEMFLVWYMCTPQKPNRQLLPCPSSLPLCPWNVPGLIHVYLIEATEASATMPLVIAFVPLKWSIQNICCSGQTCPVNFPIVQTIKGKSNFRDACISFSLSYMYRCSLRCLWDISYAAHSPTPNLNNYTR